MTNLYLTGTHISQKEKESVAQVAKKFGIDRKILIQVNRLERRKSFRRNSTILIPNNRCNNYILSYQC